MNLQNTLYPLNTALPISPPSQTSQSEPQSTVPVRAPDRPPRQGPNQPFQSGPQSRLPFRAPNRPSRLSPSQPFQSGPQSTPPVEPASQRPPVKTLSVSALYLRTCIMANTCRPADGRRADGRGIKLIRINSLSVVCA